MLKGFFTRIDKKVIEQIKIIVALNPGLSIQDFVRISIEEKIERLHKEKEKNENEIY